MEICAVSGIGGWESDRNLGTLELQVPKGLELESSENSRLICVASMSCVLLGRVCITLEISCGHLVSH